MVGLLAWLGRGTPVVRVRPFNHTGPGQRPDFVVPSLARQIAEATRTGAPAIEVGNLAARRDITDVRDVVRAYRLLLSHGAPGEVYNVCRGSSIAIQDVLECLRDLAGSRLPIVVDPARVRAVDQPDLRGDPSRLRVATGWEPEIDLDRTLADVLEAWTRTSPPGAESTARAGS
jgi:GDP-4-dehydro-6-deoxy-D-mannose reductase